MLKDPPDLEDCLRSKINLQTSVLYRIEYEFWSKYNSFKCLLCVI